MQSVHTIAYREFLQRLVRARQAAGLTQADVAKALRIPQSRVSRMESGERRIDVIELRDFAVLYKRKLTHFVP
ncbi:MAG: helix-turn-helix transcriptional regulator [Gemmatimonadales bacterium]